MTDHNDDANGLHDSHGRREYLKGAAATAAAAAGFSGTGAAAVTVPTDADISSFVADHQGETIHVPDATYDESGTIVVGSNTELLFEGTTIDPGSGSHRTVFHCQGSNWHVGGDCTILQQEKNFVRVELTGAGQFGDTTGRIIVEGHADASLLQFAEKNEVSTIYFGGGSGHVEVVNFTHHGAPPGTSVQNRVTWTNRSGDVTLRGCDLRNTGSNGFYVKPMTGRFEAHDCYFKNLNVSVARTGCDGGTLFERCCVVFDEGMPVQQWSGGWFGSMVALQDNNTTVGDVVITDCDYVESGDVSAVFVRDMASNDGAPIPSGGFTVDVSGTQWSGYSGNRATASHIDYDLGSGNGGDPTDSEGPYPEGGGGGGGGDDPEHALLFDGTDDDQTGYEFGVDPGPIQATDSSDLDDDGWINGDDTKAGGSVYGYSDEWLFDGDLRYVAVEGDGQDVTVTLDGQVIDPDDYDEGSLATLEDFERSDPLADYGGATDLYGTTTATVYEGSTALVNDGGSFGSLVSTSGLGDYPSRGDEVHCHFNNAADDNFGAFHFLAQSEQDNPDSYSAGISGQGAWKLWRHQGGSIDEVASQDLSAADQTDGWYRMEVWTDETTVYADLYDADANALLASVQADDATYSSGGVGFRSAGNGEVWDYAVQGSDPEPVVVEDFERSDPLADYGGATDLYDTTTSAYEGGQALVNDGGAYGSVASTSGLGDYPERGDEVQFRFDNAAADNFGAFHLFVQAEEDNPDSYSVGVGNAGTWNVWRHENGDITEIGSQAIPDGDQTDGWYRAEVWTDETTVYADLYDDATGQLLASVQADDATYSSGGIGFRSAGNGEVWDYVTR